MKLGLTDVEAKINGALSNFSWNILLSFQESSLSYWKERFWERWKKGLGCRRQEWKGPTKLQEQKWRPLYCPVSLKDISYSKHHIFLFSSRAKNETKELGPENAFFFYVASSGALESYIQTFQSWLWTSNQGCRSILKESANNTEVTKQLYPILFSCR